MGELLGEEILSQEPLITLSMVVKNEANRYLKQVLLSVKPFIAHAVIVDDASTDNTVEVCREILFPIPLTLVINASSKFSNEVELRKQQWEETIKTDPEWILSLDADEVFEDKFKDNIKPLLAKSKVDVYYFRLYDFWDQDHYREDRFWMAHLYYRPYLVRYKKNVKYEWEEVPQHCGRFPKTIFQFTMATSPLRLKHYGWATEEDRKAKHERYKKLDPEAKYGWKEQYDSILDPSPRLIRWQD
mgnify:CR=1 FL=1